jgi:hypothetical protein
VINARVGGFIPLELSDFLSKPSGSEDAKDLDPAFCSFLVVDPFDVTHNPGKVVKRDSYLELKFVEKMKEFVKENVMM